jgi:protein-arginine kinase activator protein McsA
MRAAIAASAECGERVLQMEAQQAQHAEREEFELAAAVDSQIKEVKARQNALQVRSVRPL